MKDDIKLAIHSINTCLHELREKIAQLEEQIILKRGHVYLTSFWANVPDPVDFTLKDVLEALLKQHGLEPIRDNGKVELVVNTKEWEEAQPDEH